MDANNSEICRSLIEWFKVLNARDSEVNSRNGYDCVGLSDGVAMARALHKFAPDFFSENWLTKIKEDVGENWRLKVSNLKKVVESIFDYFVDVLNITVNDIIRPDVMRIAEKHDENELGRMLQLILGCAINCPLKLDYIRQIMELEESLQQNIMQAIQELETMFQGSSATRTIGGATSMSINSLDTKILQEDRDRLAQQCHEANRQIDMLLDEKSSMQQEMAKLQNELERLDPTQSKSRVMIGDDGTSLGPVQPGSTRYNDLRRQLDALKEELLLAETSRDDFKIKSMELEKEVTVLKAKIEENNQTIAELGQLKDELDVLREANDKLKVSEGLIQTYKKKLEDHHDLKRQVKMLEDRSAEYLQQNMHQEEHMKKVFALKGQVELYKKEVEELHGRLDTEMNKSVKIEFELSNLNAKLTALQREKDILATERDVLKDSCDQLRCGSQADAGENAISNELLSPALREKLELLTAENKALREGQGGQTALAQLLEDANQRSEKLRDQLKSANQKILSLSQQTDSADEQSGDQKVNKEEVLNQIGQLQNKCSQLESALSAKEQEVAAADARYRKYAEKAKEVIKNLDPRMIGDSAHLLEKNHENVADMVTPPSGPSMGVSEERLLTSAFYNLSMSCQRDAFDARIALLNGSGKSFLSRQRQPPPRKPSVTLRNK